MEAGLHYLILWTENGTMLDSQMFPTIKGVKQKIKLWKEDMDIIGETKYVVGHYKRHDLICLSDVGSSQ